MFWPYVLHESFMADLLASEPCALIVLAHFAVLFGALENNHWYTKGWAKSLLQEIDQTLAGQNELASWLEWPRKHIYS